MPRSTEKYNQSGFRKFFYSKNFIFLTLCVVVMLTFAVFKEYGRQHKVNEKIFELKQEMADLEQNNFDLAKLINYMQTDEYVEVEARRNLGYKKPGEQVLVIKDGGGEQRVLGESQGRDLPNPKKWLRYFFE